MVLVVLAVPVISLGPAPLRHSVATDPPATMKSTRGQLRAPINDAATAPPVPSTTTPLWRRALAVICVLGVPIANTGSIEFGRYMEARLPGGAYHKGYAIAWLNHSILIIFLLPWAAIVVAERGCSGRELWRALVAPYGSARRLVCVTFWLSLQYQRKIVMPSRFVCGPSR